jgi:uncharacterized Zn finger protein
MNWYEASRPIAVSGGVKAKSKRGDIGTQWWSKRFIAVLDSYGIASRLARGKAYARKGQVMGFSLGTGKVTAQVQGSRSRPYKITITVRPLTTAQWKAVETRLAGAALFRAKLLAGEMPAEIEEVFDSCGTPLFPRKRADLGLDCNCPDVAVPCKHLAAVCYVLAEAFDDDPFEMLAWRGRGKDELLTALRGASGVSAPDGSAPGAPGDLNETVSATRAVLGDVTGPSLAAAGRSPADFWSSGLSAARLRSLSAGEATAETAPDLLLRMFEPPPLKVRNKLFRDLLAPAYEMFSQISQTTARNDAEL